MATDNHRNKRLQELKHSDWEISDGETDITGWDVNLAGGEEIGEVKDLIFDTESRKVRYLKVHLKGKIFDTDSRNVLIPIGLAQLNNSGKTVVLNGVMKDQVASLPEYDSDELNPEYENRVRQSFSATYMGDNSTVNDQDFYSHAHFNDESFSGNTSDNTDLRNERGYDNATRADDTIEVMRENMEIGKRQVQTGGIRVRSRIVERPVEETINLHEETVNIERVPVDRMATGAAFNEREISMNEHAEVPVVSKEARVVEEISISKDVQQREETIRDTLKETVVDVDDLSKDELSGRNRPDQGSLKGQNDL